MIEQVIIILVSSFVSGGLATFATLKAVRRKENAIAKKSEEDAELLEIENFEKKVTLYQKLFIDLQQRFLTVQNDLFDLQEKYSELKLKYEQLKYEQLLKNNGNNYDKA